VLYLCATTIPESRVLAAGPEPFYALPQAASGLAFVAALRRCERSSAEFLALLAAAGAAIGVASLFKVPAAGPLGPELAVVVLFVARRSAGRAAGAMGAALGVAALLVSFSLVWVLALTALHAGGVLRPALFWMLEYPMRFYMTSGFAHHSFLRQAVLNVGPYALLASPLLALAGRAAGRAVAARLRPVNAVPALLCLWLLVAAGALGAGGRFYAHYFLPLALPLACLAALSRAEPGGGFPARRSLRLAGVALGEA
jgi:hypothetical protein